MPVYRLLYIVIPSPDADGTRGRPGPGPPQAYQRTGLEGDGMETITTPRALLAQQTRSKAREARRCTAEARYILGALGDPQTAPERAAKFRVAK